MLSNLMTSLQNRGFIHQCSNLGGLDEILTNEKISVYAGFDCTSASLHVGSLMTLQVLKAFHDDGHKVIALIGTGTTMVGDPSGKDTQRPLLSIDQITGNAFGIEKCIKRIIPDVEIVYNHEWLNPPFLDMLREIGPYMSVNHMLTLDSIKNRLEREQHLSLLEMMYVCLQSQDFYHLSQLHPNMVQVGGSDQWGNIVMGLELIRRKSPKTTAFALTHPLLLTSDGKKMGKTENGAVWLAEDKLSSYDFWQYWRNVKDEDVKNLLLKFAPEFVDDERMNQNINSFKILLADVVTSLVRGEAAAQEANNAALAVFSGGCSDSLPYVIITPEQASAGMRAAELAHNLGLCSSISDARRTIKNNGIKVNGEIINNEDFKIYMNNFIDGQVKISRGKKNHGIVKLE